MDIQIAGPFGKPVPWLITERTDKGAHAYVVSAKTYWEARLELRVLNPAIDVDKCTFYANVEFKRKKS